MKSTQTVRNIFIGGALFILGYGTHFLIANSQKHPVPETAEPVANDTLRSRAPVPPPNSSINYTEILKGKFILKGADYAGLDFVDQNTLTWTNELFPMDPDTMKLRWLSNDIFMGIFTGSREDSCQPNIWIRKVESFAGGELKIKYLETSLTYTQNEILTFNKEYAEQ